MYKGGTAPETAIEHVMSTKNYQHFFFFKKLMIILINNSRTAWLTEILAPFFSFSDNLLQDPIIVSGYYYYFFFFQKSVDNFEIAHKISSQFWCTSPLQFDSALI